MLFDLGQEGWGAGKETERKRETSTSQFVSYLPPEIFVSRFWYRVGVNAGLKQSSHVCFFRC